MEFASLIATATHVSDVKPWFGGANYEALRWLFVVLPHNYYRDSLAEFLVSNPLASTWIFGAAFFAYWRIEDERAGDRRFALLTAVLAVAIAVAVSLAIRPWIWWPAPARVSNFQPLYPAYFWRNGSADSFPSHSTLVYFTVSLAFWPMGRRVSVLLMVLVLIAISLPRTYLGGHYPIDILAGALLAIGCYVGTRLLLRNHGVSIKGWLTQPASLSSVRDIVLFLWLFELSNGFHATTAAVSTFLRVSRHLAFHT